jgi:hypothetical protein
MSLSTEIYIESIYCFIYDTNLGNPQFLVPNIFQNVDSKSAELQYTWRRPEEGPNDFRRHGMKYSQIWKTTGRNDLYKFVEAVPSSFIKGIRVPQSLDQP